MPKWQKNGCCSAIITMRFHFPIELKFTDSSRTWLVSKQFHYIMSTGSKTPLSGWRLHSGWLRASTHLGTVNHMERRLSVDLSLEWFVYLWFVACALLAPFYDAFCAYCLTCRYLSRQDRLPTNHNVSSRDIVAFNITSRM